MKICIISHYPPIDGGISKYTHRNVEILKKKGISTSVIPVENLFDSCKILLTVMKAKPDIIRLEYATSMYRLASFSIFFQLALIKLILNIKLNINFHEVKRDIQILKTPGVIYYSLISKLFDIIFVHTEEARSILINRCDVKPGKVIVIPHGLFVSNNSSIKKQSSKRIILFFGFIHIHKGIEYLIEAWSKLVKKNPMLVENTELVIAGSVRKRKGIFKFLQSADENYYKMLVEKAHQLKVTRSTKFLGYLNDSALNKLINKSTMVVLPYTETEQSGVLNQVLPFNTPIIASNIGGIGETLRGNGVLIKPRDIKALTREIENLLIDGVFYKKVQKNYKKLNKSLDPHKLVTTQINYYKLLINNKL